MKKVLEPKRKYVSDVIFLALFSLFSSFLFVAIAYASGLIPEDVIVLANKERTEAGLSLLSESAILSRAAEQKANDMIANDYFSHISPSGVEPWYWFGQNGYQYKSAGENLAINYDSAEEQHDAWMKSETHRANIMNANYQEIGVAVKNGKIAGKESTVTVEFFGTPLVAAADNRALSPVTPVAVEVMPPRISWIDGAFIFATLILSFSILVPPLALFYRTYQHIKMGAESGQSDVVASGLL